MELPTREQVFGTRQTPRSNRGVVSADTSQIYDAQNKVAGLIGGAADRQAQSAVRAGEALSEQGRVFDKMSAEIDARYQKRKKDAELLQDAKLQSMILERTEALTFDAMRNEDWQNSEKLWEEGATSIYNEAMSIVSPEKKDLMSYAIKDILTKGRYQVKKHVYDRQTDSYMADVINNDQVINSGIVNGIVSGDESRVNMYMSSRDAAYRAAVNLNAMSASEAANRAIRENQSSLSAGYDSLPFEKQVELFTRGEGNQPLSVRNNNPGNIRGADGNFKKFSSKEEGLQAMRDDLKVKISGNSKAMKSKFGDGYVPSITNVISTWAPNTENDTSAYIKTVSEDTGISPDKPLALEDLDAVMSSMIKVEGGEQASANFSTGTFLDKLPPEVVAQKRRSVISAANSMINTEMTNIANGVKSGPDVDARIQAISSFGDEDTQQALDIYNTVKADAFAFSLMSPKDIMSTINTDLRPSAMSDGATDKERARLDMAERYYNTAQNGLSNDAISYAVSTGVLPSGVADVDINDAASIAQRRDAAKAVYNQYGAVGFFTADERSAIKSQWDSALPEEKVSMAKNISIGAGDFAPAAYYEILKDSPDQQYVGAMVSKGDAYNESARLAFFGMDILDKDKTRTPKDDVKKHINDGFGAAISDLPPDDQSAMRGTAISIYTALGGDTDFVDTDLSKKAVAMASAGLGDGTGVQEIQNRKTVLPPMVNKSRFEAAIAAFDDEDLYSLNTRKSYLYDRFGDIVTADDLKTQGHFRVIGDGFYSVYMNSDDKPLSNKDGTRAAIRLDKNTVDALNSKNVTQ